MTIGVGEEMITHHPFEKRNKKIKENKIERNNKWWRLDLLEKLFNDS